MSSSSALAPITNQSVTLATTPQAPGGMPRTSIIPTGIAQADLMSASSSAASCFIDQQFSGKLQAFLVGYVNSIFGYYSVYEN